MSQPRPWMPVAIVLGLVAAVALSAAAYLTLTGDEPSGSDAKSTSDSGSPSPEADPEEPSPTEEEPASGADDPMMVAAQCLSGQGMTSAADEEIPEGDIETQVEAVRGFVEQDRNFQVDDEFDIEFVDNDELRRRVTDGLEEDLDREQIDATGRVLTVLGAMEPGTDLLEAQMGALEAGVAGFYDPETAELVIGSTELDALGVMTTSHELVHALADASFGLVDLDAVGEEDGADAQLAALSAVEGDASLYGTMFALDVLSFGQLLELEQEAGASSEAMEAMPHVVVRSLEFPYIEGLAFTCQVFQDGGWDAVDATYTEPPITTAQILDQQRYVDGETAEKVRAVNGPDGWKELQHDTFGAADLLFLLEAPGDDEAEALSDPRERAAAWAGGEYTAWADGDDTAVGLVLADRGGATSLCETVDEFYAAAFPDAQRGADGDRIEFTGADQSAVLSCEGTEVALGIAPDLELAAAAIG